MIAEPLQSSSTKSLFCIAILGVVLAGCSTTGPLTQTPEFEVAGKVSVRTDQQARSGRFIWRQFADFMELEVWGPLGQGRVRLVGTERAITVTQGDRVLAQGDASLVMYEQLGWYVPLPVFNAWLQGAHHEDYDYVPVPPQATPTVGDTGRPQADVLFSQLGWQVHLSRFELRGGELRPGRISAHKDGLKVLVVAARSAG